MGATIAEENTKALSNVIRIDDKHIQDHLGKIERGSVEETLNAHLNAGADRLCSAERYERTEARQDKLSGIKHAAQLPLLPRSRNFSNAHDFSLKLSQCWWCR